MSVVSHVPHELVDAILKCLAADTTDHTSRNTLLSCSRVSYAWRELSLPHRFRQFVVRLGDFSRVPEQAPAGTEDSAKRPVCLQPRLRTIEEFDTFLKTSSGIAYCIRELCLSYTPTQSWRWSYSSSLSIVLSEILGSLPRLRSLKLHNSDLDCIRRGTSTTLGESKNLDFLSIGSPRSTPKRVPLESLAATLAHFGAIYTLRLKSLCLGTHIDGSTLTYFPRDLAVTSLIVDDGVEYFGTSGSIFRIFLDTPTIQTLRSLDAGKVDDRNILTVINFIHAVGPGLRHLACFVDDHSRNHPPLLVFNFQLLPNLQTLSFRFDMVEYSSNPDLFVPSWVCIASHLASLYNSTFSSPILESLTIDINASFMFSSYAHESRRLAAPPSTFEQLDDALHMLLVQKRVKRIDLIVRRPYDLAAGQPDGFMDALLPKTFSLDGVMYYPVVAVRSQ